MRFPISLVAGLLTGLHGLGPGLGPVVLAADSKPVPIIDVILWFDTEDYLLPGSDDAAKRVAETLSERGIRGTFKLVGEKARTLERRSRRDVIAALKRHAIAYHTDFHSVHPTPSEYLADCGFLDGLTEFIRRESKGADDVRRIFGVKTLACYGQPGSSWAAQAVAALRQVGVAPSGVPCYVDEGSHVGLNHQPFWYAGAINVYDMGVNCTRMELHDPAAVEPARQAFTAIADRLRREQGGGLISIYYHPCEWVHLQFWDGVNFARGQNPPREEWKAPPQRTPAETDAAFRRFGQYLDQIRSVRGVRFVTASDLPAMYPDLVRIRGATETEVDELAGRILNGGSRGVDFQVIGRKAFSVADQFELLTLITSERLEGRKARFPVISRGLWGPDKALPPSRSETRLSWPAFRSALTDVRGFIQTQQRVPARVFIGSEPVPPSDFLVALASVHQWYLKNGCFPTEEGVVLGSHVELRAARHVAEDTPELFGGWVIHPADFRAPRILEVARLQSWTLKPALRRD